MPLGLLRDPTTGQWSVVEMTRELIGMDRPDWSSNTDYLYSLGEKVVLVTYVGAKGRRFIDHYTLSCHKWAFMTNWYGLIEGASTPVVIYSVYGGQMCRSGKTVPRELLDLNMSIVLYSAVPSLLIAIPPASNIVLHGDVNGLNVSNICVPQFLRDRVGHHHFVSEIMLREYIDGHSHYRGNLYIIAYGKQFDPLLCKNTVYHIKNRTNRVREYVQDVMSNAKGCECIVFQTYMGGYTNIMVIDLSTICVSAFYNYMTEENITICESTIIAAAK